MAAVSTLTWTYPSQEGVEEAEKGDSSVWVIGDDDGDSGGGQDDDDEKPSGTTSPMDLSAVEGRRNGWCMNPLVFRASFSQTVSLVDDSLPLSAELGARLGSLYSLFPHSMFGEKGCGCIQICELGARFSAGALDHYRRGNNRNVYNGWVSIRQYLSTVHSFGVPRDLDIFFTTPICVYAFHVPSTFAVYTFPQQQHSFRFPECAVSMVPGVDGYFINFYEYTRTSQLAFFFHVRSDLSYSIVLFCKDRSSLLHGTMLKIETLDDYLQRCYHAADSLEEFMTRMVLDHSLFMRFIPSRGALRVYSDLARVYSSNCHVSTVPTALLWSVTFLKQMVVANLTPSVVYSGTDRRPHTVQRTGGNFPIYGSLLLRGNANVSLSDQVTVADAETLPMLSCGILRLPPVLEKTFNDVPSQVTTALAAPYISLP